MSNETSNDVSDTPPPAEAPKEESFEQLAKRLTPLYEEITQAVNAFAVATVGDHAAPTAHERAGMVAAALMQSGVELALACGGRLTDVLTLAVDTHDSYLKVRRERQIWELLSAAGINQAPEASPEPQAEPAEGEA